MLIEKYRPTQLDQIIGQDRIIEALQRIVAEFGKTKTIPHMLFIGPPGTGKTTTTQALVRALYGHRWRNFYVEKNASDERGIDIVRGEIKEITRTASLGGVRVLHLDEADMITFPAQNALRRTIGKSRSTRFILTGNYEHQIVNAIKSRHLIFRFRTIPDREILRYLLGICKAEQVAVDLTSPEIQGGLIELVRQSHGDLRAAINDLEKLITGNTQITKEMVLLLQEIDLGAQIIELSMNGDFEQARQALEDAFITSRTDPNLVVIQLYEAIKKVPIKEHRIKLFEKLGEIEHHIKTGGNPLVQLTPFVSFCWVIKHLPNECPARR